MSLLLFAGDTYYPGGGAYDFIVELDHISEAKRNLTHCTPPSEKAWAHVLDTDNETIVAEWQSFWWTPSDTPVLAWREVEGFTPVKLRDYHPRSWQCQARNEINPRYFYYFRLGDLILWDEDQDVVTKARKHILNIRENLDLPIPSLLTVTQVHPDTMTTRAREAVRLTDDPSAILDLFRPG